MASLKSDGLLTHLSCGQIRAVLNFAEARPRNFEVGGSIRLAGAVELTLTVVDRIVHTQVLGERGCVLGARCADLAQAVRSLNRLRVEREVQDGWQAT